MRSCLFLYERLDRYRNCTNPRTNSVQKNAVHLRRTSTIQFFLEIHESTSMIPISHENRIYRPIEVRRRWPVDSQRSQHAITILQRVMTMVPRCSILYGLEFVCEIISCRDRALRNRIDTVMFKTVQHSDTMPMDCCAVVEKTVLHGNL